MMTPILFSLVLAAQAPSKAEPRPSEQTLQWRREREKELKADRGWLAVSGLPWLKEGETTIGSGEGNVVRLADGPKAWGAIARSGTKVALRPSGGAPREITTADPPFQIGRTWVQLIQRSELVGLRIWDPGNPRKLAFPGLEWYEVKPEYRVLGRLVPGVAPSPVRIANVLGQVNEFVSPGVVEFEMQGRKFQLTPVFETPEQDELFYIFKDGTSARTTYGAGRFLYSALPDKEGVVVLDFNRANSPPCAFTDFATCPLPPPRNRLLVSIEAGEKDPHKAR